MHLTIKVNQALHWGAKREKELLNLVNHSGDELQTFVFEQTGDDYMAKTRRAFAIQDYDTLNELVKTQMAQFADEKTREEMFAYFKKRREEREARSVKDHKPHE